MILSCLSRSFVIVFLFVMVCVTVGAMLWVEPADAAAGGGKESLGTYPATAVAISGNAVVVPDSAPAGVTTINVSTNTNFKGTLTGDPSTGVVRIADAHPAGMYEITVTADGPGGRSMGMFQLTVNPSSSCSEITFEPVITLPVGDGPRAAVVGDFNNDGNQDVVTANASSNDVSVLLGDGKGGFAAAVQYPAGMAPVQIATGDLNGDGRSDLVTASGCSVNCFGVSVLLGDGNGGFGAPTEYFTGGINPVAVIVGDFNRDGWADIARVNLGGFSFPNGVLGVLLGNGNGGFGSSQIIDILDSPSSAAIADYDGDGDQDIVYCANAFGLDVGVMTGDGLGGFMSGGGRSVPTEPYRIAIGDLNNDGSQDVVTGDRGRISSLLGNGTSNFGLYDFTDLGQSFVNAVALADLNGDGRLDVVAGAGDDCLVLLGDGNGGFGPPLAFSAGQAPGSIAIGDFNGDGRQDIATATSSEGPDHLKVFLRTCDETPTPTSTPTSSPSASPTSSPTPTSTPTNTPTATATASPTPNHLLGKLAFSIRVLTSSSAFDLVATANHDGSGDTALTSFPPNATEPAWSPDRLRIAFVSYPVANIAVMDADGGNVLYLTNTPEEERNPSWSVLNKIAYERSGQIWQMNPDGSGQVQFPGISQPSPSSPAWSPDGLRLAFASGGDIWLVDSDGSNEHRLTVNPTTDTEPAWSPDGSTVIFSRGASGLAAVSVTSSVETGLTEGSDTVPAWSADGTKIVFHRGGTVTNDGIYLMDVLGNNQVRVLPDVQFAPGNRYDNPVWEPLPQTPNTFSISGRITREGASFQNVTVELSGSASASTTTDIFGNYEFGGLSGEGAYTVTPASADNAFAPASFTFSELAANQIADFAATQTCIGPNCRTNGRIAFVRAGDIYAMNSDGSALINLTNTASSDSDPSYSPDGIKIAFTSGRDGNSEIYEMDADGAAVVRLTNDPAYDAQPAYSPDGTKIVFVSDRVGNTSIYTMDADGTNQVLLVMHAAGVFDSAPSYSPDGTKIVFLRNIPGMSPALYTVNADGTNVQQITTIGGFYDHPRYSPDGSKYIFDYGDDVTHKNVWTMNIDGTNRMQFPVGRTSGAYSPDGQKVVCVVFLIGPNSGIFVANADGSSPVNLTHMDFEQLPNWQPLVGSTPTPTDTPTNTPTVTPTDTPTDTPTATPTSETTPEIDLSIYQTDSPDPVTAGRPITYVVTPRLYTFGLGGIVCPVVRFNFPTGVPLSFVGAEGAEGFRPVRDADGVTFSGGCLVSAIGEGTVDLSVIVRPLGPGILTSPGSGVIVDPQDLVDEANENNNTAFTAQTTVLPAAVAPSSFDYDADGRTDMSVFRPETGAWYEQRSTEGASGMLWGFADDRITPADFDGDGRTDIAVYRPSEGIWYVFNSADGTISYSVFGITEDLPTPADYDGDGKADVSVFRPSSGTWYRENSSNRSFSGIQFGQSGDRPFGGDLDGDGRADLAVFRPSDPAWYQLNSSNGQAVTTQFGYSSDVLVPADYDGDGKVDIAVYRPSTGYWYVKNSGDATVTAFPFGLADDIPAPGDFDGDGKSDYSVFRPSDGNWYRINSLDGSFFAYHFGQSGDKPTQSAFRY